MSYASNAVNDLLSGSVDQIDYDPRESAEDLVNTLDDFREAMDAGERFLVNVPVTNTWYTMTPENLDRLQGALQNTDSEDGLSGSDGELLDGATNREFNISLADARDVRNYGLHEGEFWPYTHHFECEHLSSVLATLGCWNKIDYRNYDKNCLYLALQHADVSKVVLQDLACCVVRRKIARKNLHAIAVKHSLLIVLRTEDDHNIFHYGDKKDPNAFRVELALIKTITGEHYIHYFRTDINAYALSHYDELKHKNAWWTVKSADGKKDTSRGMHSLALMKYLRDSGSLSAIDATTRGVFLTQYHDRLSRAEYITLAYPEDAVRQTHSKRLSGHLFGRGENIDDDADALKKMLNHNALDEQQIKALQNAMMVYEQYAALPEHMRTKLDEKMSTKRFALDEQLSTMRRAIPPNAVVFFDFESSPFGEHSPYGVCYSDYSEDAVHSIRGADCAEALMDDLLEVYGRDCPDGLDWGKFKPPVVKLMAHNATYDYSFLFEHLRRVKFLEKGTSLICGTALISNEYMRSTESPNAQLVRWMTDDAWEAAERDDKLRRQWRRALQNIRKASAFVTIDNLDVISRGASDVVAFLREKAPFDVFEPEMISKRTYRALSISLQDTYKMIPMPLSQFGKSFNLPQGKEVMPHALMTKEFVASGGIATADDVRKAVYEMHVDESSLVNKLTRLVADHGGVEAVRKLGCSVHATVVDGDSDGRSPSGAHGQSPGFAHELRSGFAHLWLKIDFNYAPDDLGLRLDELHAKKAHLAAYRLIIEHYGNDDALRSLVYEDLLSHVIAKAREYDCEVSPGLYDMVEYSMHYCAIDVQVLKDGWRVFHDLLFDKFALSTFHFPTLAGLADRYFIDEGCFACVCELSGVVQSFIAQCSVGGRVMCAHNKRSHVVGKIADFDGVSLYPSSMYRLGRLHGGYLIGRPKVWDASVDLGAVDGYFLKIRVTKVGRAFAFPIARVKTAEGSCNWTNDLVGRDIFVDRFTLEDLVTHSEIGYNIIQGYYFDQGRNNMITSVISTMFDERLRIKKEDKTNPLQLIIKLMMNSGYGKCGLKAVETDTKYIADSTIKNYIQLHFNHIRCMTEMSNGEWRVELYKEIETHFNRQHVACEILSTSKNIMNEVMCTAEDIDAPIYYTDTDSMHMNYADVNRLADEFQTRYGRTLIGKHLGQFHVDFDFDGAVGEIHSEEAVFIAKKTYIDVLRDEAGNRAYHIRCKGIPSKCIDHTVKTQYAHDPLRCFMDFYSGKSVVFNLSAGGSAVFKISKKHTVSTVQLKRKVCFPLDCVALRDDN